MVYNVSLSKNFPFLLIPCKKKLRESSQGGWIAREYPNTERTIQDWMYNKNGIHIQHA